LRRRPGERVKYSNLGPGLLGEALARAAGQSYEDLVLERICLPLGMRDTVVTPHQRPHGPAGHRAHPQGQAGGTSGFRSFCAVAREAGTAVVVLSNTARSVDRLGLRLLKALSSGAGEGVG